METLIYDKVYALNIDVQNQYLPGGRLAVEGAEAIIEPLNKINRWVSSQTAPDPNWRSQNEQLGEVILTRDEDDKKAGTAFPDDFDITPAQTFALDSADWYAANRQHQDDWETYRNQNISGWYAALSSYSKYLVRSDGRSKGTETVKDVILNAMNLDEYSLQSKVQRRAAIVLGGIALDDRIERTVRDAFSSVNAITERLTRDHTDGREGDFWHRDTRRYGPKPLVQPLGIFVVSDALKVTDEATTQRTIERLKSFGAQVITATDIVTGNAIPMRS